MMDVVENRLLQLAFSLPPLAANALVWPLIANRSLYEVDPLVCPACGSRMKVIAVIQDTDEIKHILRHLIKIGRAPPGLDESSVN